MVGHGDTLFTKAGSGPDLACFRGDSGVSRAQEQSPHCERPAQTRHRITGHTQLAKVGPRFLPEAALGGARGQVWGRSISSALLGSGSVTLPIKLVKDKPERILFDVNILLTNIHLIKKIKRHLTLIV